MKNFKWTDEDVKEFCRVYTIGGYTDDYKDCKTIEKKMNKFKILKKIMEKKLSKLDIVKHLKDITDIEDIKVQVNDLAIIVNNNYPDVRKMLNTIQVSTVDNTLKLDNDVLKDIKI